MRTTYRIASAVIALGAVFPLGLPAANAADGTLKADIGGWFWSAQQGGSIQGQPRPAAVPASGSGVNAPSNLSVAYTGVPSLTVTDPGPAPNCPPTEKCPDKVSFLFWDVASLLPEGAVITKFTVSVPFVSDGSERQTNVEHAKTTLVACNPLDGFGPAEGEPYSSKPPEDCAKAISGKYQEGSDSMAFDVTAYAVTWLGGTNNGISIRPGAMVSQPFQVVFKPFAEATANVSYTSPVVTVDPPALAPAPPVVVDGGTAVAPPLTTNPEPQPQPQAQPQPVVPLTEVPRQITRVAVSLDGSGGLPFLFWLAMLAGVLVLGWTSLVLGDPEVRQVQRRQTGLTRALHQRSALGSGPVARVVQAS